MPAKDKTTFDIDSVSPEQLQKEVEALGGQRAFSRKYGIPRSTLQLRLHKLVRNPFGHRPAPEAKRVTIDAPVARFILTSAQDETVVHHEFLDNLEAYRDHLSAFGPCELMIAGFTYNKRLFENHDPDNAPYWDRRILPYKTQERIRLGDRIDFCGEMNTMPTAVTPLSGFETYTRSRWGIFPHAKVQLRSVPNMKDSPAKIIMTTGAVTKPNYVRRRAGITASFHHAYGAVLVEIAQDGTFFCRHLLGEEDGSFYDLTTRVETQIVSLTPEERKARAKEDRHADIFASHLNSRPRYLLEKNVPQITSGHRIKAINHGDLHVAQIDPEVARATFGYYPTDELDGGQRVWRQNFDQSSILDTLRPEYQFFHDVADFQSRNHHNLRDPHHMYTLYCEGVDSVEEELREVATFIESTKRDWCKTVVVESNHDLALRRWLKEADYRQDPMNAEFFLSCQMATYRAIRLRQKNFSIFEHVLTEHFGDNGIHCADVQFLREDESFMVLDIEKGMHGHLGANGARGTPHTFVKAGAKSTTGHTHSCEIRDGAYVAGTTSKLDMGYNKGLSSWSNSHVVTYPNGKRAILTLQNGKAWL